MKVILFVMSLCIALAMLFAAPASADTPYLYGIHDYGANNSPVSYEDFEAEGVTGWIVLSYYNGIGHDPDEYEGWDLRELQKRGYTPICRLDNSTLCNGEGTLPLAQYYHGFAQRVQNFVRNSKGCHIWIIGNEPNRPEEWPSDPITGVEPITVDNYVYAYMLCWHAIKDMNEHQFDLVLPAAVCTWQNSYPKYPAEDPTIPLFDDYFVQMLNGIAAYGTDKVSGIPLHVYTHGYDRNMITDEYPMEPPFDDIDYNFQVYKDYMEMIETYCYGVSTKPVYITEAGQIESYGQNTGWADEEDYEDGYLGDMYDEIAGWNSGHPSRKIRCVALYRWGAAEEQFDIHNRGYVRGDWCDAIVTTSEHKWTTTLQQDDAGLGIDALGSPHSSYIVPFGSNYYNAYMESSNSDDYYEFYVQAGQTITVSASRPGSLTAPNVYVYIYAPGDGYPVASCTSGSYGRLARYKANSTGWWYARVHSMGYVGNYLLGLSLNDNPFAAGGGSLVEQYSASCSCDSFYNGNYPCGNAVDGDYNSSWRSGTEADEHGEHWIACDLGCMRAVTMFKVNCSATTSYALRRFKIQSAESMDGPWVDEFYVDNATRDTSGYDCYSYAFPKSLQYVRLLALDWGTADYAEVREFRIYANTSDSLNTSAPSGEAIGEWYWSNAWDSYSGGHWGYNAFDHYPASCWMSADTAVPHYIVMGVGGYVGYSVTNANCTVKGFVVKHAEVAGFSSNYNTRDYVIQSGPTPDGPWTDECTAVTGNTASTTYHSYPTPKNLSHVRLYITNPGIVDNVARIAELEMIAPGPRTVEDLSADPPVFTTTDDYLNAATWETISGSYLQASRDDQGISTVVKVFYVPINTNVTIAVDMKVPSIWPPDPYVAETAFKLGTNTAEDYLENPWSWTVVKRFSESGSNGNSSTWMVYDRTNIYTGSCATISVGFKHAAFGAGSTGPVVCWDDLRIN